MKLTTLIYASQHPKATTSNKFLRAKMFEKKHEYRPNIELEYADKITCLVKKDNRLWIGREDGILECHNENVKFNAKVFETEYDYLESEEIKAKISAFEQVNDGSVNDIIYVGNEKGIKVFKIRNDAPTIDICNDLYSPSYRISEIKKCPNTHAYVLNSLSLNRSREYLASSDYIKINLWKPEKMSEPYNIIDLKPQLVGGVVFVINSCKFNPFCDGILAYSSSNGEIYLNDISITPKSQEICSMKNTNTESIKSISDFAFIDSNLVISRSLNNICLFDVRSTKSSIFSKELITNYDEQNMLNSSDAIYEKFKIATDGMFAYSGSYLNSVYSVNVLTGSQEEVLVGEKREFSTDNKIRLVVAENDGFTCVLNGSVFKYIRNK